jgi:hypothetical protein
VRLDQESARLIAEDLASEIEVAPYLERLDPVVAALANLVPPARIAKLSGKAAAALWDEGLRAQTEAALQRFEVDARELLARVESARTELARPVTDNRLATALVEQLAADFLDESTAIELRLEELDDEVRLASPGERREVALRVASEFLEPTISDDERYSASASFQATPPWEPGSVPLAGQATRALARSLATEERRRQTRATLADLATTTRDELPFLTSAIDELLGEPIPDDAGEDDVWVSALFGAPPLDVIDSQP